MYDAWSHAVGGVSAREVLVGDHVKPWPGMRLLDLGCGTGELLEHLEAVSYVGVNLSEPYVRSANQRYGSAGAFRVGNATAVDADLVDFDVVVAVGVLHHLDDAGAKGLLHGAARALRSGGRLVTIDPTLTSPQSRAARAVIRRDRGQAVRSPGGYRALAEPEFASVIATVREDLLRIPYTHCLLEATTAAPDDQAASSA